MKPMDTDTRAFYIGVNTGAKVQREMSADADPEMCAELIEALAAKGITETDNIATAKRGFLAGASRVMCVRYGDVPGFD